MPSRLRPRRHSPAVGSPPGEHSPPFGPDATAQVMAYGPHGLEEHTVQTIEELAEVRRQFPVVWIDIIGHGDDQLLTSVREVIGLHPLAIEDVVNLGQRPKLEEYEENLFCVTRMVSAVDGGIVSEQLSLCLAEGVVVTFQERVGDCLDPVRRRIRDKRGRVRSHGADYLFYALIDAVVDAYAPLIEDLGDRIEEIEEQVLMETMDDPVAALHKARRSLLVLRKAVLPLRDSLSGLLTDDYRFVTSETVLYFRDCVDHLNRAADMLDSYRDLSHSVMEAHISVVNQRMNDVIALLTVVSTIFIPLSFLAGLWGMNFDYEVSRWNMPELHLPYAYPVALALMFTAVAVQLWFFRRKGWLRLGR